MTWCCVNQHMKCMDGMHAGMLEPCVVVQQGRTVHMLSWRMVGDDIMTVVLMVTKPCYEQPL